MKPVDLEAAGAPVLRDQLARIGERALLGMAVIALGQVRFDLVFCKTMLVGNAAATAMAASTPRTPAQHRDDPGGRRLRLAAAEVGER
jgi:hypothetical protein